MDVTAYNTALSAAGGGPSLTAAAALAAAASVLLLPLAADGKKVFGIARGGKFAPVGDFCFSVPPGMTGALVAETMLQEEGHELLIHSKSAAEEYKKASINAGLSFDVQEEEGGEGGGGGGGGGGDKSLINTCNALHNNARVRETLAGLSKEELSRGAPPAFFELNLAVDSSMDGQEMTAWITRCAEGQTLNAAYSVTFLNPGGFFTRQFSCQDQGLLQLYMVMSFLAIAICASSYRVYKQQQRQTSPLAAAATCCCCILGTSIVLQTFHLIVYAALSMVALGVVAAALMSLLGGTFFPDELNPASLYTTVWALPLHIITGVASGQQQQQQQQQHQQKHIDYGVIFVKCGGGKFTRTKEYIPSFVFLGDDVCFISSFCHLFS
ncbi:endonuclease/exonuclease/phosphatase domain-containing protein, putative [Eimeria maxima]|uniref:Endonuclease/exonuclease/phosphatase domain-containing protein, putative n=1 Tax=Eimeria maxima TaxID=5804 RepID=U6M6H1_EIMMA|nr:endonuclease/exonuclease/phosphatase domain-containing protein, putative [Eimeria maxima]CDJ58663.1 endonuclease/exonuclease/phosphatase domain-containing protein, putative [Eimeria maxima]